jgi:uncharacterized protein (DUF4415 family)
MKKNNITRYSVEDVLAGKVPSGRTDWKKLDTLTDDDIVAAMRDDPDWADLIDIDWSDAVLVQPVLKTALSIRLDPDILDFFKKGGKGYQSRINAVLRHYVESQKKGAGRKTG